VDSDDSESSYNDEINESQYKDSNKTISEANDSDYNSEEESEKVEYCKKEDFDRLKTELLK
jgi:hypothetical protein